MNDQNPYQPPAGAARLPRTVRYEQSTLRAYLDYHRAPPSLAGFLARHINRWFALALVTGCVILAWSFLLGSESFQRSMPLAIGILMGYIIHDCTHARLFVRMWPMLDDIFDWERVQAKYDSLSQP